MIFPDTIELAIIFPFAKLLKETWSDSLLLIIITIYSLLLFHYYNLIFILLWFAFVFFISISLPFIVFFWKNNSFVRIPHNFYSCLLYFSFILCALILLKVFSSSWCKFQGEILDEIYCVFTERRFFDELKDLHFVWWVYWVWWTFSVKEFSSGFSDGNWNWKILSKVAYILTIDFFTFLLTLKSIWSTLGDKLPLNGSDYRKVKWMSSIAFNSNTISLNLWMLLRSWGVIDGNFVKLLWECDSKIFIVYFLKFVDLWIFDLNKILAPSSKE